MLTMEQAAIVTKPGEEPPFSHYGYCVTPDGTIYAMLRQWWHGAVLALLYPEAAKEAGYELPDDPDELNVYEFQRFELDNHNLFPVIRICPSRLMGPLSLDRGSDPATPEQIAAIRAIFKELGMSGEDEISTDHRDMNVRDVWAYLTDDKDVWSDEPRVVNKHRIIRKGEDKFDVLEAECPAPAPSVALRVPDDDDGFGENRPVSFEEAEGVVSVRRERNDE